MDKQPWLKCQLFQNRIGELFTVSAPDGPTIPMTLVEATESAELGGPGPDGEQRRQFSLVWAGPGEPMLPQATYVVANAVLGELEIFLVPLGPRGGGIGYEAVFA